MSATISAPPPEQGPWLSIEGLARRWHLTAEHVRRGVRRGLIPARRVPAGRKLLISRELIERLESTTTPAD